MKMIDRFMNFSNLVTDYRRNPSIVRRFKCDFAKKSILSEIDKLEEITVKDVFEYMWVYNYACNKFPNEPKKSFIPENVDILSAEGFSVIHYNDGNLDITVKAKEGNLISDDEYFDSTLTVSKVGLSTRSKTLNKNEREKQIFELVRECFYYILEVVTDKLLKGD